MGKVLGPTSSVQTGVNSQLDLYLGDNGPTVRLLAETTLGVDKLNFDRTGVDLVIETFLDLKTGTVQGYVKPMAVASRYEVKTPFTVCAIKGTEYQISADGVLHVMKGSVIVAYGVPANTYTVNAGQTFVPPAPTAAPGTPPVVRSTTPADNVPTALPPEISQPGIVEPIVEAPVTAPEPVEFVSPGTGQPAGQR
ncbi:MAG: FecR domain-containing protein [Verrucomicrobia bacterium]|nr:FecR domain-containing protein [Verrucomicrobiota bacterium]